jgi:hypothetical protein
MALEYAAWIAEKDYETFKRMLVPIMPESYELWLRVRERGKRRAFEERATIFEDIAVSPEEFMTFCERRVRPEFNIYGLDLFAREKGHSVRRTKAAHA